MHSTGEKLPKRIGMTGCVEIPRRCSGRRVCCTGLGFEVNEMGVGKLSDVVIDATRARPTRRLGVGGKVVE